MKKVFCVQSVCRVPVPGESLKVEISNTAELAPEDFLEFSFVAEGKHGWFTIEALESIFKFEPGQKIEVTIEPSIREVPIDEG
jgi:hypothetical protein